MIISGIIGIFLYFFYLGSLFNNKLNTNNSLEFIYNSILFSIYFSWIIVVLSFFLDLNLNVYYLLVLITAIHIYKNYKFFNVVNIYINKNFLYELFYLAIIFLLLSNFGKNNYQFIFLSWDALASYNRWAMELFSNNYKPMGNAAYPILFPGMWSLIYKAQGNAEFWILSKLSILFLPLIFLLIVFNQLLKKNYILFGLFIFFYVLVINSKPVSDLLLSGYMDGPIILLISSFLILLISKLDSKNGEDFVLLSILVGLISITKQSGLSIFPLYLYFLYLKKDVFKKRFILVKNLLISIIPYFLFILLFTKFEHSFFGTFSSLSELSSETIDNLKLIQSFKNILIINNPFFLLIMIFFSILSIFNYNKIERSLSIFSLILFIINFSIYSNCCVYDSRNAYYLSCFLIFSSYFGVKFLFYHELFKKIPKIGIKKILLSSFIIIIFFLYLAKNFENELTNLNDKERSEIVDKEKNMIISKKLENLGGCSNLYTNHQLILYNYYYLKKQHKIKLSSMFVDELKDLPNCNTGHILWFGKWTINFKEWKLIQNFLINKNAKRIDNDEYIYIIHN